MSNNPRNIIEQNVYTPTPGEAQGVWKPWENMQAMYSNTWPGSFNPIAIEYFIVGGGGNGGSWASTAVQGLGGRGGGAGGVLTGTSNFDLNTSTTVIVGAGAVKNRNPRDGGTASTFGTYTSGGTAYPAGGSYSAGGGGSTSAGLPLSGNRGGSGGQGTIFDWEITSTTVAGGGGGGSGDSAGTALGGFGFDGGGAGGNAGVGSSPPSTGEDGSANTGGGGGGGGGYYGQAAGTSWNATDTSVGAGGSGVVWIRYPQFYLPAKSTTNLAEGYPIINNGYRIYKWITSGAITF